MFRPESTQMIGLLVEDGIRYVHLKLQDKSNSGPHRSGCNVNIYEIQIELCLLYHSQTQLILPKIDI
jgi:hypothetical protein